MALLRKFYEPKFLSVTEGRVAVKFRLWFMAIPPSIACQGGHDCSSRVFS